MRAMQAVILVAAVPLSLLASTSGLAPHTGSRCARRCYLRGGGGVFDPQDDRVTPDQIREIGGDVLKMWEVSHMENLEESKSSSSAGAKEKSSLCGRNELSSATKGPMPQDTMANTRDDRAAGITVFEGPEKMHDDDQAASAQGKSGEAIAQKHRK